MSKKATDELRAKYLSLVSEMLANAGEDVLRVGTGEIALPVVDSEGNDQYVVLTVKIPSGSRDGEPYDAYGLADDYVRNQAEKAEKAREAAEKKAKKIERDQKMREERAAAKAAHQAKAD